MPWDRDFSTSSQTNGVVVEVITEKVMVKEDDVQLANELYPART